MAYSLTWLPDVLRKAGLKVTEVTGWKTRGRSEMGRIRGIICHHTADGLKGNYPSLNVVRSGRPGLSGPLAQLGLGRDGTWYVIAAGRANHAGAGRWQGISSGNTSMIGIEAENSGYTKGSMAEAWTPVQLESYARGVAAICDHLKLGTWMVCGHKEYALPPGRKVDPTFEMTMFRAKVNTYRKDGTPKKLSRTRKAFVKAQQAGMRIADSREFRHPWEMIHTMIGDGLTEVQAFGWTGNAQQESYERLETDVWGDAGKAHGIFQWHPGRWRGLELWARKARMNPHDLKTQVLYSLREGREHSLDAHKLLRAAVTIEQAVDAGIRYTRPGRPNRERRVALANGLKIWWPEMKAKLYPKGRKRGAAAQHWGC